MKHNNSIHGLLAAITSFFCLLILLIPLYTRADTVNVAGFIDRTIWYAPTSYYIDDTVRIYTVVMNLSENDMRATVTFYVDDKAIGSSNVTLRAQDTVTTVWYDWTATEGEHSFTAKITNSSFSGSANSTPVLTAEAPSLTTQTQTINTSEEIISSTETTNASSTATTTLGLNIDTFTEKTKDTLENIRDSIDKKLAAYAAKSSSSPITILDTNDPANQLDIVSQGAEQANLLLAESGSVADGVYRWILELARSCISFLINLLGSPVAISIAIISFILVSMKIIEILWHRLTRKHL